VVRLGLVSDTHGLLRPEALDALAGVDRVLHAGDIGAPEVLAGLTRVAPVLAVRGNNDRAAWAADVPEMARLRVEGRTILLVHAAADAVLDGADVVVSGHSHRPGVEERAGVLWVNPGSAGPRRFRLPVTVAVLEVDGARAAARVVSLL
jgi:putative phosphoesterase